MIQITTFLEKIKDSPVSKIAALGIILIAVVYVPKEIIKKTE